jgi:ABC-type transport system involved in multi-copper enzyme maturation permease subunit
MRAILILTRLTLHEAARRRILTAALVCGAAYLLLFAIGLHFLVKTMPAKLIADVVRYRGTLIVLTLAGLYATNFLTIMTAVLLPVDTLSGEIASGVAQTVASKPIRRSEIVLGKWLGFVLLALGYLALLAGGVLGIGRLVGHVTPPDVPIALALMGLEAVLFVSLSIAGGARFSTITNGVVAFGFFGVAFIGNWVEQIGTFAGNDTARYVGTVASLLMPSESLWQLAAWHMQPLVMRQLQLGGPFSPASVPTPAMVWWAAGYIAALLLSAIAAFRKRGL